MDAEAQGSNSFYNMHSSTTAAIQTLCFLVALGVSLSISHWMTLRTQTVYIPESSVESLLTVYMILAIIIMWLLWRSKCSSRPAVSHGDNSPSEMDSGYMHQNNEERARWLATRGFQIKLRQVLPLIGVAIFFTLGSFQDVLRLVAKCSCFSTYIRCGSRFIWKYVANLMYHLSRLVFMGTEMLFCYVFYNRRYFKGSRTRYGLVFIVSATVMIWFDITLYDSDGLFNDDETIRTRDECKIPQANKSVSDLLCIWEVTELYNSTLDWSKFFYPMNIEFMLLVMEMLLHFLIMTMAVSKVDSSASSASSTSSSLPALTSGYGSIQGASTSDPASSQGSSSEIQPLLEQSSASHQDTASTTRSSVSNYGPLLFFAGLLLNVLLVALGILTYQTNMQERWVFVYEIARTFYWLSGIAASLVGFYVTRGFQCHNTHRYKGLEIMVIMSASGIVLYCCFTLESILPCLLHTKPVDIKPASNTLAYNIHSHEDYPGRCTTEHSWMLLFDTIFNLVELYLQTNFLSHAFHLKPGLVDVNMSTRRIQAQRQSDGTSSSTTAQQASSTLVPNNTVTIEQFRRKRRIFRSVVTYLILSNFTVWTIHSFIEMKNPLIEPIQVYYFTLHRWEYIIHLTMPLCLFYRFNSFILFTEIYLNH